MKRRKIRYDRIVLLVVVFAVALSTLSYALFSFIEYQTLKSYQNYLAHFDEISYDVILVEDDMSEQAVIEVTEEKVIIEEEVFIEEETEPYVYLGSFRLTGYCACEECCGQWADGYTATMTVATAGRTIAVDPNIIPLGSHVIINGHEYIAEDTGSAINQNRIDIYCDTHAECFSDYCNGYADVYLVVE